MTTNQQYEYQERVSFHAQLMLVEKAELATRKENAQTFLGSLQSEPSAVVTRIGWLLNGSYGYGAYKQSLEVARNKRMNRNAWLFMTIAALEWNCTRKDAAKMWNSLDSASQAVLNVAISREIVEALTEDAIEATQMPSVV